MLIKPFLGEMSGKLAGMIFTHSRGGSVVKRFRVPTNPNSTAQQSARTTLSQLVVIWLNTLTSNQRASWEAYAQNVPVTNRLGDTIKLTGQNHFVRSNSARLQSSFPLVTQAPSSFNLGEFGRISIAITTVNLVNVTFDDTEEWADEDDSGMILQQSRGLNPSINFFKGPFLIFARIQGDATTAPTSPAETTATRQFADGQKVFIRARITRADGRLSAPQIVSTIVTIP